MGLEKVSYNDHYIYEDSIILSRLQVFFYVHMSKFEHPEWFIEQLKDIYGNSYLPVPKFFFDEEEIENIEDRKKYVLQMMNNCIEEMSRIGKKSFITTIEDRMKNTFFDLNHLEDINDEVTYERYYIGTFSEIKKMIEGT